MPTSLLFRYSDTYSPPAPVALVTIRAQSETRERALIDSGADGTIIPYGRLLRIGAPFLQTSRTIGISGKATLVDLYLVEIQIGEHRLRGIKAIASRATAEVIIGRDVLNHLIVTLDGIAGETAIS